MATVRRCPDCKGAGIIVKRLDHPIQDDGEVHPTRCWTCRGAGFVDEKGNPVHRNVTRL